MPAREVPWTGLYSCEVYVLLSSLTQMFRGVSSVSFMVYSPVSVSYVTYFAM